MIMYSQLNINQSEAREARNLMHGYILPTLQHEEALARESQRSYRESLKAIGRQETPYTQSLTYRLQQARAGEVVPITEQEWVELYQHTSI